MTSALPHNRIFDDQYFGYIIVLFVEAHFQFVNDRSTSFHILIIIKYLIVISHHSSIIIIWIRHFFFNQFTVTILWPMREYYFVAHTNDWAGRWRRCTLTAISVLESLVVGMRENRWILVAAQKWSLVGRSIYRST